MNVPANVEEEPTRDDGNRLAYTRRLMLALSHSRPSYRPSPLVAQAAYEICESRSIQWGTRQGGTHLDEPRPLPETVEAELVGDLGCVHGVGQILLVGEDKQKGITELILVEHPLQLLACLRDTFPIV